MIYIGTTEADGQAIYLDIHAVERRGQDLRVSALIGDGCYEGEVLVECAAQPCITFADAWLGGTGLTEFLQRSGTRWLQQQLVASVRDYVTETSCGTAWGSRGARPHPVQRRREVVAEPLPVWSPPA